MSTIYIPRLSDTDIEFPNIHEALEEPNGLLAYGGDLSSTRLLKAYSLGIFPWYTEGEPILWWSPSPRAVIFPHEIKISKSLNQSFHNRGYQLTFDKAFSQVIQSCAKPMPGREETWITTDMQKAYLQLSHESHAHSIEVWLDNELVGGLYGVAIGQVFFGESMFSLKRDASKVALVYLCQKLNDWGYQLVDCQVESKHLTSLGAKLISRENFQNELKKWTHLLPTPSSWSLCEEI